MSSNSGVQMKKASGASTITSIAVLTSGGDSQGMNCVLYGLVKYAERFTDVYLIHDGYVGLVNGGPKFIEKADSEKLARYLHQGGTVIGSSRCAEFRQRGGRKRAAKNLLELNIQNLLVVGGDGSLTGANLLRSEWPMFVNEILAEGLVESQGQKVYTTLNLIGIIGSIDNDFNGSDMTVGADSALMRIVESVETIRTTASSHHRAFVIEVMGRNCGYLALATAFATESSFCLIPEYPQKEGWQEKLRERVDFERQRGVSYHMVILSEGARTLTGTMIKADEVRDFMDKQLKCDTRAVILAHLQRGGKNSAYDRLMSVQLGIRAAEVFRDQATTNNDSEAIVLTINSGKVESKNLMVCIDQIKLLEKNMKGCKWDEVLESRGPAFAHTWSNFLQLQSWRPVKASSACWAIMHMTSVPLPGVNAIVYALVRCAQSTSTKSVFGVQNGLQGLLDNRMIELSWESVIDFTNTTGSLLGCTVASMAPFSMSMDRIEAVIRQRGLTSLVVVGDNRALDLVRLLDGDQRETFRRMQIVLIPTAISPHSGLERHCWLGYDSMLNRACDELTNLRLSNMGTFNRLFLVQTDLHMATIDFVSPGLFAISNGLNYVYPVGKEQLMSGGSSMLEPNRVRQEAETLRASMVATFKNQMVLAHTTVSNEVFQIYQAAFAKNTNIEIIRVNITAMIGPMAPSPFDRKLGIKLGVLAGRHFLRNVNAVSTRPMLITRGYQFVPI